MTNYPGEDPNARPGSDPAGQNEDPSGSEHTQPVSRWERQAAEQAEEHQQGGWAQPSSYGQQGSGEQGSQDAPPPPSYGQPQPSYGQDPYAGQGQYGQDPYGQQQPYGQSPYAAQPAYGQQPYGAPAYGGGFSPMAPNHPQAVTAMVLGLVAVIGAFVFCGIPLLVSPFAWAVGHNALKEIRASGGQLGGESQAKTGKILGIVGTVLLVLLIVVIVAFIIIAAVAGDSSGSYDSSFDNA